MRHHLLGVSASKCFLIGLTSDAGAEAVKVFLLAGNSNMTGTARVADLISEPQLTRGPLAVGSEN